MKKIFFLLVMCLIVLGCSKEGTKYSNPNLPNNPVYITLDLNLPAYDKLKYPNNSVIIRNQGGVLGVIIFNAGSYYTAFDIACPNHPVEACSEMKLDKPGSIFLVCACPQHQTPLQYSLITGTSLTPGAQYQLKPYPVTQKGNTLSINY